MLPLRYYSEAMLAATHTPLLACWYGQVTAAAADATLAPVTVSSAPHVSPAINNAVTVMLEWLLVVAMLCWAHSCLYC